MTFPTRIPLRLAGALAAALLALAPAAHAQTAVSNLGQSSGATATIGTYDGGGEEWRRAFTFTTGSSASSFNFTGLTMTFNAASGSPGALTVALYSTFDPNTTAGGGSLLSTLSLSSGSPTSSGNSVFTGSATLQPSTTYYLQFSSATAAAGNYYSYPVVGSGSEDAGGLPGWTIGNSAYESNYNNTWTTLSGPGLFSVQASAIPEPSTYAALAGLGALGLALWRRRVAAARSMPAAS